MKKVSRRKFIQGTGTAVVAATALPALPAPAEAQSAGAASRPPAAPSTAIRFTLNGPHKRVEVEDRWTLAELLRDHLGLTGTKIGCDRGECGACTVLLDGKTAY